ncbi:glycosyltransferase family 39 protein [Kitasatospora sp. NPDC057015]|uniref:glycosyltransferase family 39 protein n=1 Tax=Kitasatospora sp. NPDC057015 TaxID=3346001 RepID=UPI0036365845
MMPSETDSWFTPQTPAQPPYEEEPQARYARPAEHDHRRPRAGADAPVAPGYGRESADAGVYLPADPDPAHPGHPDGPADPADPAVAVAVADPRQAGEAPRAPEAREALEGDRPAPGRHAGPGHPDAERHPRGRRGAAPDGAAAAEAYGEAQAYPREQAHPREDEHREARYAGAEAYPQEARPHEAYPREARPHEDEHPDEEHAGADRPVEPVRYAGEGDQAVALAPYRIPQVPATGWDHATSPRRRWIGRGLLFGVLAVQAALSLRLLGAAHPDEAVAMIVGRQQLDHLLNGAAVTTDLVGQIPGSPWLYPPLAGAAANASGIFGARLLSLVFALVATALLYSITNRLFNERAAICGAGAYAVLQSTVVVGFYAAPDALAVLLVAGATWIVVRTSRAPVALVLLAAPVAALAVAVEYASVFALPTVVALALITAWPYRGRGPAVLRAALLAVGTVAVLLPFGLLSDVVSWTPARGQGTQGIGSILTAAAQWGGLFTVLAVAGGVAYVRRERMNESPETDAVTASRLRRIALTVALCGTALLIPALHAYLQTSAVMFRHIGFGMLFAAPLAGVGITRLVGAHFRNPQLGILVWVVLLALGLEQAALRFQNGPDSGRLLSVLRVHADPKGRYLTEVDGLPEYYLGAVTRADQWVSARKGTDYVDPAGVAHHGDEGTVAAIRDGWFSLVVLDSTAPVATDRAVAAALGSSGRYRLIAQFTSPTGDSDTYKVFLRL